jgi:hypothetical protein
MAQPPKQAEEIVSLATVAAGFSIEQEEWLLRKEITQKIINSFIIVNVVVLLLIFIMFVVDTCLISHQVIKSGERLITEKIIITVIGATTVQFGAIAVSISTWLFKKKPN